MRPLALACDAPEEQQLHGEHDVVKLRLANLRQFPWNAAREAAGCLALPGAHFDVRTGQLILPGEDGRFAAVGQTGDPAAAALQPPHAAVPLRHPAAIGDVGGA